jgi:hypothetical protein
MDLTTKGAFPRLSDPFLDRAARGFAKRAKTIRFRGTLGWRTAAPKEAERLEVIFARGRRGFVYPTILG